MKEYDAIIIGGGLGGLECGRMLAAYGRHVAVLERSTRVGGCLQSYRRKGFNLDTGFHYIGGLGKGEALHDDFRRLGLLSLPWQRMDPVFDRITIRNHTFGIAQDFHRFVETLAADFPHEREALQKYALQLQHIDDIRLAGQGAWDYLHQTFSDPLLIDVLSGSAMKMELRRDSFPLFNFLHCNAAYIQSAWRLAGDGNMIADTLADGIRAHGGDIVCNAEVQQIETEQGRAVAVRCSNGNRYGANLFISDIHPALTLGLLDEHAGVRPVYRHRICRQPNTMGMFTVSLILKKGALPYFNYNHYVYPEGNVWAMAEAEDNKVRGVMVSCRVPTDGSGDARVVDLLTPMLWEECAPWAGTAVGHRGADYEAMKRRKAEECLDIAEQVVPSLRAAVEEIYTSTPLTYQSYTLTPEGSAFGMRKDYHQPLTSIISPRTPIPNLLLTGQSLAVHGIEGVTKTAMQVAPPQPSPVGEGVSIDEKAD